MSTPLEIASHLGISESEVQDLLDSQKTVHEVAAHIGGSHVEAGMIVSDAPIVEAPTKTKSTKK